MRSIEEQIDEILFDLSAENRYNQVRELLSKEKQLVQANATLYAWEIFRNGISEKYPELLKWCPLNTITNDSNVSGNYEPLYFLLPSCKTLETMEEETEQPASEKCKKCDGFGSIWKDMECKDCPVCHGEGNVQASTITIHDPELPGVVIVDNVNP